MSKRTLHPHDAKVAATFYEPVYQRLIQWRNGQNLHLLCFVAPTPESVQQTMQHLGARRSQAYQAKCFGEIWELPDNPGNATPLSSAELANLDQQVVSSLGCLQGRYSAEAGILHWAPAGQDFSQRLAVSRLLKESRQRR